MFLRVPRKLVHIFFFNHPFAVNCWRIINLQFNDAISMWKLVKIHWECSFSCIFSVRPRRADSPKSSVINEQHTLHIFMTIFILLCWTIWTTMNSMSFRNHRFSVQECRRIFREEMSLLLLHRARKKIPPLLDCFRFFQLLVFFPFFFVIPKLL